MAIINFKCIIQELIGQKLSLWNIRDMAVRPKIYSTYLANTKENGIVRFVVPRLMIQDGTETSDVSADNISTIIRNKYASYGYINNPTAINAIVKASSQCQLNGYSILAKIINEQGSGSSPLATGSGYNGQYVGYYNFFNVGAYGNGTSTVITNGLKYAQNKGWNSVE